MSEHDYLATQLRPLAVPVDQLILLPGNPRRGDVDAVAASLAAFGQRKPIVARSDGTVIAGNHTLQAARSLGWTHIAVVQTDDDDVTAKAFALADNRTAELGDYDQQLLADLIGQVQEVDADLLAATGWDTDAITTLLAQINAVAPLPTVAGDPDDVPPTAPAITVLGDVWVLGPHRLVCGDATVPTVMDRLMANTLADMVWTDPPYGVSYVGKTADALTIDNDNLNTDDLLLFLSAAFTNTLAACRPGASWFVASPPGPIQLTFLQVLVALDIYRQGLVWIKDQFVLGRSDYHYRHEPILYGWAPGAAHQPPPDRTQDSIWEIPRPKRNADHPTMKPVALIERAITNHTTRGQAVLDPFAGSGSTLLAAHGVGRVARLIELDPRYCDVICKRYQLATGTLPIAESTGREHDFSGV
ncbi:MAG: DNA modification methylase [Acidimicrobiales bacterium]